jgi:uncharacterized protein
MISLALMALAVAIAAFVQGAIGVGFALIVAPLAAVTRPDLLPGSLLILMLPLNAYVAWRERHHLDWPSLSRVTAGRFVGTFAGLWILLAVSTSVLNLFIGAITILAALITKLSPKFTPNQTAFVGAGFITGVTETATGIGGPPLAIVYQHYPAPVLRATLAMCFLIGEIFSVVALIAKGRLGVTQLVDAAWLILPLVAGLVASGLAHDRISATRLRDALLIFAVVSGIVLIVQALLT